MRTLTENEMNSVAGGIARPAEDRATRNSPFPLGSQSSERSGNGGGSSNSDPVTQRLKDTSKIAKDTCGDNGVKDVSVTGGSKDVGAGAGRSGVSGNYGSDSGDSNGQVSQPQTGALTISINIP